MKVDTNSPKGANMSLICSKQLDLFVNGINMSISPFCEGRGIEYFCKGLDLEKDHFCPVLISYIIDVIKVQLTAPHFQ